MVEVFPTVDDRPASKPVDLSRLTRLVKDLRVPAWVCAIALCVLCVLQVMETANRMEQERKAEEAIENWQELIHSISP